MPTHEFDGFHGWSGELDVFLKLCRFPAEHVYHEAYRSQYVCMYELAYDHEYGRDDSLMVGSRYHVLPIKDRDWVPQRKTVTESKRLFIEMVLAFNDIR